jgi:hypothetical protein
MRAYLSQRTQAQLCRLAGDALLVNCGDAAPRFAQALRLWSAVASGAHNTDKNVDKMNLSQTSGAMKYTAQRLDVGAAQSAALDGDHGAGVGGVVGNKQGGKEERIVHAPTAVMLQGHHIENSALAKSQFWSRHVADVWLWDRSDVEQWARAMRGMAVALLRMSTNGRQRVDEVGMCACVCVCVHTYTYISTNTHFIYTHTYHTCMHAHISIRIVSHGPRVKVSSHTHTHTHTHYTSRPLFSVKRLFRDSTNLGIVSRGHCVNVHWRGLVLVERQAGELTTSKQLSRRLSRQPCILAGRVTHSSGL